jgi:hypothetical protein
MKCDILNFEWASSGRDIDIVEPVLSYLEIKYNYKIVRESIIHFPYKIIKYKPRMIVISNSMGATSNLAVVKLAFKLGIKVVTLVSEGDFVGAERIHEFFWGCNKEEVLYETLHLEWSYRNLELIRRYINGAEKFNIGVTGATAFDRYKFLPFMSKCEFLKKYKKENYSKIVGLAAWGFDLILGDYFSKVQELYETGMGIESIIIHRESKELLRQIYKRIIENNTDTLFILKYHPGVLQEELTEMHELDSYDNVIAIKGQMENIADIINVCDIWGAYESTTCLEAWLLNKKTMLINPAGADFKRSQIAEGSPIKGTYEEVQEAINMFFSTGELIGFDELKNNRDDIISNIIQWSDGKNHIRAGEIIHKEFIKPSNHKLRIDWWGLKHIIRGFITYAIEKLGLINFFPFNRKFYSIIHSQRIFGSKERTSLSDLYKKQLKEFYEKNGMEVTTETEK